jgi:hypothetical protein
MLIPVNRFLKFSRKGTRTPGYINLANLYTFVSLWQIIWLSFLFSSCSKKDPEKLPGKWKVEEVGLRGMEITYEFTKDKIYIESKLDKNIADSLGQEMVKKIEENYSIKPEDLEVYTLLVVNKQTNDTGQYVITIDGEKMHLTDFQGEKFTLIKLKSLKDTLN